jgi:hypothetical protein
MVVIANLAKANLLMRLPLLRVVQSHAARNAAINAAINAARNAGRMAIAGDCLRDVIKEILFDPSMLSKFHFRGRYTH